MNPVAAELEEVAGMAQRVAAVLHRMAEVQEWSPAEWRRTLRTLADQARVVAVATHGMALDSEERGRKFQRPAGTPEEGRDG